MIHLHNHSCYSYAKTFVKVDEIINKAKDLEEKTFAICDSDSLSAFFSALTAARKENMKAISSFESYLKPPKDLDISIAKSQLASIKGLIKRKKLDETMVENLRLLGINTPGGTTDISEELREQMDSKYNELSDKINNKIRLESGQLKDSKLPLLAEYFKTIFIAKNQNGLANLMKIYSANTDGVSYPEFNSLKSTPSLVESGYGLNSKGIKIKKYEEVNVNALEDVIVAVGFDGSELSWYLERNLMDRAMNLIEDYKGLELLFVLEGHGIDRDKVVNAKLIEIYEQLKDNPDYNIKLVAANDTYYVNKKDRGEYQLYQSVLGGMSAEHFTKDNQHMMTEEEMIGFLKDTEISDEYIKLAMDGIRELEEQLEYVVFPKGRPMEDLSDELKEACYANIEKFYPTNDIRGNLITVEDAKARLDYELETISDMGFSEYFIKVKQITDTIKDIGALKGTARGSAAGSLVSYLVGITDVDPIKYGLFFERFLNKGRGNQPMKDKEGNQMYDYDGSPMYEYAYPDIDLDSMSYIVVEKLSK